MYHKEVLYFREYVCIHSYILSSSLEVVHSLSFTPPCRSLSEEIRLSLFFSIKHDFFFLAIFRLHFRIAKFIFFVLAISDGGGPAAAPDDKGQANKEQRKAQNEIKM